MRIEGFSGFSPTAFGQDPLGDLTAQADAALYEALFGPQGLMPQQDSFGGPGSGQSLPPENPMQLDPTMVIGLLIALLQQHFGGGQQQQGGGGCCQCRGSLGGGGGQSRPGSPWSLPSSRGVNGAGPALNSVPQGSGSAQDFLQTALSQQGKAYVFGAEADGMANPGAFDCSELVQWSAARAGVNFVDGSANQRRNSIPISVEQALNTPGALLFRNGHVAISVGDGQNTIEARGRRHGVTTASGRGRFTSGGLIPGLNYG